MIRILARNLSHRLKIHPKRSPFQAPNGQQNFSTSTEVEIIDVNMNDLFSGDTYDNFFTSAANSVVSTVDIDPWVDEESLREGTVDMDMLETYQYDVKYADPLENRSGSYEFKGIEIWLPKKMLTTATYRYGLHQDEAGVLPDDTRICRYEK